MQDVFINNLQSGGLITNYYCTSKCKHCLYSCSPKWPKEYISRENAEKYLEYTKTLGNYSLHIGGGEPFLDKEGLLKVVKAARNANVKIDYIETNSSWFKNTSEDKDLLHDLGKPLDNEEYTFISILYNEGITGFFNHARDHHGFKEKETYLNKCDLCLDIRKFLVKEKHLESKEFQPEYFYHEL